MYSTLVKAKAAIILANIAGGAEVPLGSTGLCYNLDELVNDGSMGYVRVVKLIPYYAEGWPHHSGRYHYPVPTGGDPTWDYHSLAPSRLWRGEQGELRRSLAKFVSGKLASEIGMR